MCLACASPRCRPRGATAPPARAASGSGSGCRATCTGTGGAWPPASRTRRGIKMRFLGRLIFALACAALTLQPAAAFATPSPSPALSGILAPPPTADYVEADATVPGVVEGQFDAKTYASRSGHGNVAAIQQTLERDGFLDAYGRTWVQKVSRRVLVEFVMAFTGGDGANKWLSGSELADKADPNYQHSISVTGVASYYGARFFYSSNQ